MSNLYKYRSDQEELMDNLFAEGEIIEQALRELEVINKWLGGNYVTLNAIEQLIKGISGRSLHIIDIGCGGGDMLKLIARWAKKRNKEVRLTGIDANPNVIKYAQKNCIEYPEIHFMNLNIFSDNFKSIDCDIITATLFTHHFSDTELIRLFKQFKRQASVGIAINDIHRHFLAHKSINLLTTAFSKSDMVKNDAGISVLRAFSKNELIQILKSADIENFRIKWMWAFRWQLVVRL